MPIFQQFPLPDAGEGLTEAEIVAWHVAVGDTVEVNQTIVEIETAKSLVDLPSPWAGVVTRLLVEPGRTVDVGIPIIEIDTDPTGADPAAEPTAAPDAAPATGAIEHGHRGRGNRHAGVEPGGSDEIAAARAAGPTAPEPAAREAVLVGYGLAEASTGRRGRTTDGSTSAPAAPQASPAPRDTASRHALAKPPVRKLARELGVDLDSISATGPGGIVTREDVLGHAAQAEARTLATYPGDDAPWLASGTVSADGRQTRVPVKSVRKRTAEAMVASAFTAPHVTVFHTVDVTKTMKLVERLRADREFADVRVTPLLIAAKALMLAVRRHPDVNASWDEASQEIVYKHYINLGIAASTPRGLVVPNIKDAHRLSLKELASALADLTATARAGRTSPADMSDGTITITNVGVFGIDTGTPILNPGEAAILAFGAIREQPWVHKGKIKIRHVTQLALSVDHRLVDGALGSQVLADVARVLHDPSHGLVWG
ncbi:dihydrolipoamide acetyltransferase family protein [Cellulomonas fengjieae]|uniref:Dihydrolipoamide acetyltransferase component of pyruvate dehydrogenase complex n=1 Tax=Cellulomonas fengjieae TaxID=2819978 RepID=A0ABS3SK70_9CELL|nr:dihydrolipoamide acetyltransferase family protein [Cellulomonas fengjieae]MBO3086137.1 2-oxo acid dehydrogenase subunit E2 [Cellulomonas fengjieae]QVI65801.1 2-oxo acid dehydrogenase subunit E2 [Cellulomonas fengjieae]